MSSPEEITNMLNNPFMFHPEIIALHKKSSDYIKKHMRKLAKCRCCQRHKSHGRYSIDLKKYDINELPQDEIVKLPILGKDLGLGGFAGLGVCSCECRQIMRQIDTLADAAVDGEVRDHP